MKTLTVIFFLLLFVNVFSQSQKKQYETIVNTNKQLYKQRDSLSKSLYERLNKIYEKQSKEKRILNEISSYFKDESELESEVKTIIEKYNKLTKSNLTFKEIELENNLNEKNDLLNISSEFNSKYNKFKDSCYSIRLIRNPFNLDTINKYRDKNRYLNLINDSLMKEFKSLQLINEKLTIYDSLFNADFIEYEHFNSLLRIKFEEYIAEYKPINIKLEELHTNFKNNGPTGFSKEYFEIWPYTHVTNVDNKIPQNSIPTNSQDGLAEPYTVEEPKVKVEEEVIFDIVDEKAQYPGGQEALKKYIKDNLKFPQTAIDMGIEGKCYLKFIVSQSGNISNVKVVRGVTDCPECDKEAIRLIKAMPDWIPGKINGKPVNSTFTLPVQFKLD
jgi:TonB family protein